LDLAASDNDLARGGRRGSSDCVEYRIVNHSPPKGKAYIIPRIPGAMFYKLSKHLKSHKSPRIGVATVLRFSRKAETACTVGFA
jgi:hypothetical protein